jgi:hypothetical protein
MGESKRRQRIIDAATQSLSQGFMDAGKFVAAGFAIYKGRVLPEDAPQIQIDECRWAFFAGAQHLFHGIMGSLEEDKEPTEADMQRMDNIDKELREFAKELELRMKTEEGKG